MDDKTHLYCLSSGAPASKEIEEDLLNADKVGKQAYSSFVQERLIDKTKSFNAPIKKLNLKTFATDVKTGKVTGKVNKSKQITAERNVFGQLLMLAIEHNISLERVLNFPLGPVPWALATSDGTPVKTDKAKLMHHLEGELHIAQRPKNDSVNYIADGNAILQSQVALPSTFGEFASNIFDQLPNVPRVDFVTDSYLPMSIKSIERDRRGKSKAHLLKGPLTKIPRDWKSFLSNEENKQSLIKFLLAEWKKVQYAPQLKDRLVVYVCESKCYSLTSENGEEVTCREIEELNSDQEEADTKIILHLLHMEANTDEQSVLIIRSPDTDVFILSLKFAQSIAQKVFFDTGVGNKRRLIDIKGVIQETGRDICSVLPAVHAFCGCDTTSAFVRKGKLTAMKLLKNHPGFIDVFKEVGKSTEITDAVFQSLEHFTCLMYGGPHAPLDINKLRYEKFLQRFSAKASALLSAYDGIDMSLLPPCRDTLVMHIRRVNYQAYIWNLADKATACIPSPVEHGWLLNDGVLDFKWMQGDLMPQDLADVLVEAPD